MSYGGDPHVLYFMEIFGSLTMNVGGIGKPNKQIYVNTNETMKFKCVLYIDTHDVAMPIPYMNKESFLTLKFEYWSCTFETLTKQ